MFTTESTESTEVRNIPTSVLSVPSVVNPKKGTADDDDLRKPIYKRNRDVIAYNRNYNAHNQFFEYLSTYGILGAIVFVVLFYTIFALVIRHKNSFFLFIFFAFLLASMTESLLERTLGIVYFGLALSFLIILTSKNDTKINKHEHF